MPASQKARTDCLQEPWPRIYLHPLPRQIFTGYGDQPVIRTGIKRTLNVSFGSWISRAKVRASMR